jgi:hypothetical protein
MNTGETDLLGDRWLSGKPVYLTDLSGFGPAGALSGKSRTGHWRTLEYEAEGLEGTMLLAGPETAAPDISYPLGVAGWHAISFGVLDDGRNPVRIMVRLSGEKTFTILTLPEGDRPEAGRITELFWKAADITGQELVLGQVTWQVARGDGPGTRQCTKANVAYVKLTPMSDAEVAAFQTDSVRTDTRTTTPTRYTSPAARRRPRRSVATWSRIAAPTSHDYTGRRA